MRGAALLIETHVGRVAPGECDHLGHMNVQFYVSRVSDAAWHVMASIGITPSFIRERRQAPAAVRQEIAYLRELRAGDLLRMDSGVVEASEKRLTFSFDPRPGNAESLTAVHRAEMASVAATVKAAGIKAE